MTRPWKVPADLWQETGAQIRQLRKAMGYPRAQDLAEAMRDRFGLLALPPVAKWESGDPPVTRWGAMQIDSLLGCEGYLLWMRAAAASEDAARRNGRPRLRPSPLSMLTGCTTDDVTGMVGGDLLIDDPGAEPRELVHQAAGVTAERLRRWETHPPRGQIASEADSSTYLSEDGPALYQPLAAGSVCVHEFVVLNSGDVPWRDRFMMPLGHPDDVQRVWPALWPLPDTDPGQECRIRLPLRAPRAPGLHYPILRQVLADGHLAFPSAPRGLDLCVLVPHADLQAWWPPGDVPPARWMFVASSTTPVDLLTSPKLGAALRAVRESVLTGQRARLSRRRLAAEFHGLYQVAEGKKADRLEEIEAGRRGLPPGEWAGLAESLRDLPTRVQGQVDLSRWTSSTDEFAAAVDEELRAYAEKHRPLIPASPDLATRLSRQTAAFRASSVGRRLLHEYGLEPTLERLQDPLTFPTEPVDRDWCITVLQDHPLGTLHSKQLTLKRWRLRNDGESPWRNLLLARLGPAVASQLPATPCAVTVPDTDPGQDVVVAVPLIAPYLSVTATVHFVPITTLGRPAWPHSRQSLSITVTVEPGTGSKTGWRGLTTRRGQSVDHQTRDTKDTSRWAR